MMMLKRILSGKFIQNVFFLIKRGRQRSVEMHRAKVLSSFSCKRHHLLIAPGELFRCKFNNMIIEYTKPFRYKTSLAVSLHPIFYLILCLG